MAQPASEPRTWAERDDVLQAVAGAWERHPHLRLGQLLSACLTLTQGINLFYIEDAELVRALDKGPR